MSGWKRIDEGALRIARGSATSSPSREAQVLLDAIDAVEARIAGHEAELRKLRRERYRLRTRLQNTGYRDPVSEQQLDLFENVGG